MKQKNITEYIFKSILVSILLVLSSCKGYLSVQPQGKVLPKTDEEFAAIIHTIIYDIESGEDQFVIGNFDGIIQYESYADNLDANVKIGNIPAYVGDKINTLQYNYRDIFSIIRDCNIVIENIANRETELAKKTTAAAYAIKGICYYNLIRIYCQPYDKANASEMMGLPIIETFDMEYMPTRSSLQDTYNYCVSLLEKSISYNISDKLFLFTKDVVNAYLAKLYFWGEDWDSLTTLGEELMQLPAFQLANISQYPDMIQAKNASMQEVIARSHSNNDSDIDWYYILIIKDIKTRPVSASLVKLFEKDKENDVRYAISFDDERISNKTLAGKYRSSELVLMLAEAYAHKGDNGKALEHLNSLRRERIIGVSDYTIATLPEVDPNNIIKEDALGKSLTPLISTILNERRKELYMEGDRWFELKRNGTPEFWVINNGLKYTTKEYLYTAPIYRSDIFMNPLLIQNPGYEE